MTETDKFDEFLKSEFEKNKCAVEDEGFAEKVISELPANIVPLINRKFILYLSGVFSVFIFYISNGYKTLVLSIINFFSNAIHFVKPSLISFFMLLVFISVSFIITRIDHDEDLI